MAFLIAEVRAGALSIGAALRCAALLLPVLAITTARIPAARAQTPVPAVTVHIDTSEHAVQLEGHPDENYDWMKMCDAPCDAKVPRDWEYRIVGEGLRASSRFVLRAAAGDRVVLTLHPASEGARVGGQVLVVVGSLVGFIGAYVFEMGVLLETGGIGPYRGDGGGLLGAGSVIVLGAVAAIFGGAMMIGDSSHSRVDVVRPPHVALGDPLAPRAAIWNERTVPTVPGVRAASAIRVLTIAF
jgi:hypothetical protein